MRIVAAVFLMAQQLSGQRPLRVIRIKPRPFYGATVTLEGSAHVQTTSAA